MKIALVFNLSVLALLASPTIARWTADTCVETDRKCWVCHGNAREKNPNKAPYNGNCVDYNSIFGNGNNGHANLKHNYFPEHNKYNDMIWCTDKIPASERPDLLKPKVYDYIKFVPVPANGNINWGEYSWINSVINGPNVPDPTYIWLAPVCNLGDISG